MAKIKTWLTKTKARKIMIGLILTASLYNGVAHVFDQPVLPESFLSFVKSAALVIGGL
ncbi:hypothetical protein M977_04333 [Buttiauxella gaviniae ATCC 51604]|uniref:Uncharacterized protein n=1 Tax=Buttiauxella gaviniae ATCC 51604 TaxID=1354253 RepID=A0A1B7HN92_9ENTR|nr:hypothetical protein [Buttiauxella gaviniae]OAT17087.1 hypothetical protein M977_04333 [Buttiauxella gaviniae ATCC 51604]